MSKRILVVDDDQDILDLLEYNLTREGFKVRTEGRSNEAVATCLEFDPDLIILDVMMPEMNGIEICKQLRAIRKFRDTFIFFLTARSEGYYQEAALETGGDDYIEKIVGLRSLTGKIKTVLKLIIRKRIPEIHVGDLHIHRRAGSATVGNREIRLSRPEFELLFFFAQNPKKVISTDYLLANVLGSDAFSLGNSMELYIDMLMQKLNGHWIFKISNGKYWLLPK